MYLNFSDVGDVSILCVYIFVILGIDLIFKSSSRSFAFAFDATRALFLYCDVCCCV